MFWYPELVILLIFQEILIRLSNVALVDLQQSLNSQRLGVMAQPMPQPEKKRDNTGSVGKV